MRYFCHDSTLIESNVKIGEGTKIWHYCQIRENASIGENCILGRGVFIDAGVQIGNNVKIQNYVSIYHGVTIGNDVFIGPHVCFTNDLFPRSINIEGKSKKDADWVLSKTKIENGVSIGANSTIRCGVVIGSWAMIGAGSVVTKNVTENALIYGNPARHRGFVCQCGSKLIPIDEESNPQKFSCPNGHNTFQIYKES